MTSFYCKILLPVSMVFVALAIVAHTSGTVQPLNPVMAGFVENCAGKPRPCWYGIVPTTTRVDDANTELIRLGYHLVSESRLDQYIQSQVFQDDYFPCSKVELNIADNNPDFIEDFYLDSCTTVYLGDVVNLFGEPERYDFSNWGFADGKIVFFITYHSTPNSNACQNYMPQGHVGAFALSATDQLYRQGTPYLWHGFLPYDLYVRKYNFPSCKILDQI